MVIVGVTSGEGSEGGAVNALAAAVMALAGSTSRIAVDQVRDAMREVGGKMDVTLRETGAGGVAASITGVESAERIIQTD